MSTPNKNTEYPKTRIRTRRMAAARLLRGTDRRDARREMREALATIATRVVNVRV